MKKKDELKQLSIEELQTELLSLRKDQFNLRMKKASGSLDKTHLITIVRRNVARVKQMMTEKAGK